MPEESLSEKLMKPRIPFPERQNSDQAAQKVADKVQPDKQTRLREFSLRFAELFPGMNNAEIARKLGTTDAVVKNYIEGKRFPNDDLLLAITRATRVNLHWLLTGEGSRRVEPESKMFDEAETRRITDLAVRHRRAFDEEIRALTVAAVEFIEKFN